MKENHINEAGRIVELAQQGNWIPAAIVAGFLGLIVVLILIIYKKDQRYNDERHESSDQRHSDSEAQIKLLTSIVTKHDINFEKIKGQFENVELKMKIK